LPAATSTSTAPPSSSLRRNAWRVVSLAITAIILFFVARQVAAVWRDFRATPLTASPRWGILALSSAVVLVNYGVLIETWRRILRTWGERLAFGDAMAIWCTSTLGRYVPGKIWQIGVMGVMAERRNVSPVAAAGSSMLNVIVNIACGFVVAVVTAWQSLDALSRGHRSIGVGLAIVLIGGLFLLPAALPVMLRVVRRLTGRAFDLGELPRRAIYISLAGNIIAWTLYGVAFQLFTIGILGSAPGNTGDYIAAWAGSYVVGYLAFAMPGGLGVREGTLLFFLTTLGLASAGQAAVIAVASRVWLTGLELLPAFYFLARASRTRTPRSDRHDVSNP
jgi:glycosyltransferase 2 family protein